jgi:hypothetical protein
MNCLEIKWLDPLKTSQQSVQNLNVCGIRMSGILITTLLFLLSNNRCASDRPKTGCLNTGNIQNSEELSSGYHSFFGLVFELQTALFYIYEKIFTIKTVILTPIGFLNVRD